MADGTSIAVVGCGYVGLVTAVGLAEQGLRVRAFDKDPDRVDACRRLAFPMIEPGLEDAARAAGDRLTFHDVADERWPGADFTFLAVPTPQGDSDFPNLSMLREALAWIAEGAGQASQSDASNVIVIRSTVPPGTTRWAASELLHLTGGPLPVVANPEFLQEGRAMADFRRPSRVLIGADDDRAAERLRELMAFTKSPVVITDPNTAELAKYGSNAFLAMRVSFANELARLAERQDADPSVVLRAVGLDPRIGSSYLQPGVGYGGSCLPKDVAALVSMGDAAGEPMELMRAVHEVNETQRRRILHTIGERLGGLTGRHITVLGLAFKPGTNDIRESPGLKIADELMLSGATVTAWDRAVDETHLNSREQGLHFVPGLLESLVGADAAVLCTEWPEAVDLDFAEARKRMAGTLLVDGRYAWDLAKAKAAGLNLMRIGSSRSAPSDTN